MSASKLKVTWNRLTLLFIALLVLLADQGSKHLIVNSLQRHQEWAPIPSLQWLFAITYTTNTGAAFGLFPGGSQFFIVVAVVVVIVMLAYYQQLAANQWLLKLGLGLQLGGAMGNLADRLVRGHVVDFIYFKFWPVFNVADSCIFVGVVLMAIFLLKEGKEKPEEQQDVPVAEGHEKENPKRNLSAAP